jgi:RNA polymerase sigma-70 factor (ECF subfamily)
MREPSEPVVSNAATPQAVIDAAIPNATIAEAPCTSELASAAVAAAVPEPALSDAEIVERVLAGDTALFELLLRRKNRLFLRPAGGTAGDDDEARDVVQAAYVRAYYHLEQFRGPAGFKGWIARIAVNEALGRARRAPPIVDAEQRALAPKELADSEPENAASSRDLSRILQAAIDRLPEEFRQVFILRGVEQLSIAETAELLDIKPATVKTRFHRARRLLQEQLHRRLDHVARDTYGFGGQRCDAIVGTVLARIRCQ